MAGPLQAQFTMDPKQWKRANSEYARIIQTAETKAIRDVGIMARDGGRKAIAAAGFSTRFAKTLIATFKPPRGISFDPSARIHSTISYSDVFETGKIIVGKPFLWLPLPDVPPFRGRPHMTPKQYVENVGPLVSMELPGRLPILGARVRTAFQVGRRFTRATLRRGMSTARGISQFVPLFVAVRTVTIPKKFNVHAAVVEASKHLQERYIANLEKYK